MRTLLAAAAALGAAFTTSAHAEDCAALKTTAQSAYRMYMDEVRRMDALPPLSDASTREQKVAWLDEAKNASTMGHWLLDSMTAVTNAHCITYDFTKAQHGIDLLDLSLKRGREMLAAEDAAKK